jgi:hypothetical protein
VFFKRRQVEDLIVNGGVSPTGVNDADPFESQGSDRGEVSFARLDLDLNKGSSPAAGQERTLSVFDPGLMFKLGLGQTSRS